MKRHPSGFQRLAAGELPSKAVLLDLLIVMVAGGVGVAVGTAIG